MRFTITKCHGSGNDFPLIDARRIVLDDAQWAVVARALADRAGPVGGDGLLLLTEGDKSHEFGMRMINSDGSESEQCLNGLRCVARAGFAALETERACVHLKTSSATAVRDADLAPGVFTVRETAGPADLNISHWPFAIGVHENVERVIPLLGSTRKFTAVAMPNPHLVAFVDSVDDAELSTLGALCEAAPPFLPNRANVSFVEVRGPDLFVRTFERGVGLTNSCGSAMAASTFAACLTERIAFGVPATVFNKGGRVRAQAEADGMVSLSGNATFEWEGAVTIDFPGKCALDLEITRRFPEDIAAWEAMLA